MLLLAGGASAGRSPLAGESLARFAAMVNSACTDLARMIPDDGEGATHRITIDVEGCRDREEARTVARAVADSPLVKTLGEDARVPMKDDAAVKAAIAKITKAMDGKLLAVQTATIQQDFAKNYLKDVKNRIYETTKEEDLDLLAGRVDAIFASTSSLVATLEQSDGKIVLAGPKFFGGIFGTVGLALFALVLGPVAAAAALRAARG